MTEIREETITFPVDYGDGVVELEGRIYEPASLTEDQKRLLPLVFNSGFTGGVAMYGQLFGKALARRGYRVMTYDVAGFFFNKAKRNTAERDGQTVTNVSLADQKAEVLAALDYGKMRFGRVPAVASWAMGSVASLAAVAELAASGGEQVPFYVPMSYTRMSALQDLRADKAAAHRDISALADDAPVPPFDTGTAETRLGYYPLDPDTQAYVDRQLGSYTDAAGADRWPGCVTVTAKSYKEGLAFDPEAGLAAATGRFPPALIVHGARNTLHMPEESKRLHRVYPGQKSDAPLIVKDMEHGQQLNTDSPVFQFLIDNIDRGLRSVAA